MAIPEETHSRRTRVLLVDDEPTVLETLRDMLVLDGFSVDTARNGREGLKRLTAGNDQYDVILTDLVMQPVGGMDLLARARKLDPDVIVILMTGHATIESATNAIRMGAYDFLIKPFQITDLKLTLRRGNEKRQLSVENRTLIANLQRNNLELEAAMEKLQATQAKLIESERKSAVMETAVAVKHEIINPLTAMITKVQVFLDRDCYDSRSEIHDCLDTIKSQSLRISRILSQLDHLDHPVCTDYANGIRMLDIEKSAETTHRDT